jgi:hypothetical protein
VSETKQAQYLGEAALHVWQQPGVTILIQFLVRDEPSLGGWQSGLLTADGRPKLSYHAFALPLAQLSGTTLWGQVRPGSGRRSYILQRQVGSSWRAVGSRGRTSVRGTFTRTVSLPRGTRVRIFAPALGWASPPLTLS